MKRIFLVFALFVVLAPTTFGQTLQPAPLTITTNSLRDGRVGQARYAATVFAFGGGLTYVWSVNGELPPGLVQQRPLFTCCKSALQIVGTPTATGVFTFSVTVASGQETTSKQFTILVNDSLNSTLAITTATLPHGQVGQAYSTTVSAIGGFGTYAWRIMAGFLPPGLLLYELACVTGTNPCQAPVGISGIPTTVGSFNFVLEVVSQSLLSGPIAATTRQFTIQIRDSITSSGPVQAALKTNRRNNRTGQPVCVEVVFLENIANFVAELSVDKSFIWARTYPNGVVRNQAIDPICDPAEFLFRNNRGLRPIKLTLRRLSDFGVFYTLSQPTFFNFDGITILSPQIESVEIKTDLNAIVIKGVFANRQHTAVIAGLQFFADPFPVGSTLEPTGELRIPLGLTGGIGAGFHDVTVIGSEENGVRQTTTKIESLVKR